MLQKSVAAQLVLLEKPKLTVFFMLTILIAPYDCKPLLLCFGYLTDLFFRSDSKPKFQASFWKHSTPSWTRFLMPHASFFTTFVHRKAKVQDAKLYEGTPSVTCNEAHWVSKLHALLQQPHNGTCDYQEIFLRKHYIVHHAKTHLLVACVVY